MSETTRQEKDLLGERPIAVEHYYGIQTQRAVENFPITGIRISQYPHLINALLNRCEAGQGRCELRAYPVVVGLNIMPICDVDCQFCSFSPQAMDSRARVTLDQFKQLDWLKYVSELALWGGIGESLINPEFPKIFACAVERFPQQDCIFQR